MKKGIISGNFRKTIVHKASLSLYAMAALYVFAGVNHFRNPETYLGIMPPWLPYPAALVAISGMAEIGLGLLLFPEKTRRLAAWGIILLLIAVFPANIQMAIDWHREGHAYEWIAWARLPLQGALIWWAWRFARKRQAQPVG